MSLAGNATPTADDQRDDAACCEAVECCPALVGSLLDEADAIELADLLKALADPARLRLVSLIAASTGGEACACDLTEPLGRSQPTVSHHLGQLVKAGIVTREQRGRWAWFRLRTERLDALATALRGR
ncbi:MAG: metalloregulator ArsR/SmtB family transcription factor [Microthrixaceae bacterium]